MAAWPPVERVETINADLCFSLKFTKARERTPENRADFEPVTMSLVDDQWVKGAATAQKQSKLTSRNRLALDALASIIAEHGEPLPPAWNLPSNLRSVKVETWRTE